MEQSENCLLASGEITCLREVLDKRYSLNVKCDLLS